MARTFNPPPNWPKPPEGWEPPPGWQPDPAWGPAPEGWELWIDDQHTPGAVSAGDSGDGTEAHGSGETGSRSVDSSDGDSVGTDREPTSFGSGAGSTGAAGGVGAAGAAGGHSAPTFGGADTGTGTGRMPQYQSGSEGPTAQNAARPSEPTQQDAAATAFAGNQATRYDAHGGAPQYQGGGANNVPPNSGGPGKSGSGGGGSKLPWILGAVIALLLVILLILVLALSGVFRSGDSDPAGGEETQTQNGGGEEVSPGGMATADPGGATEEATVSAEATELNVEPEGATEITDLGDPVETFTHEDGEIEIPQPDGEDAPQLITIENTGEGYITFEAERADGSDGYIPGAIAGETSLELTTTYSFERGNPITTVRASEEDSEFELNVYSLADLQTVESGSIRGDGNAVFLVDVSDGSTWYKMSHNGTSNFLVYAATDYEDGTYGTQELAANEIGRSVVFTEYGEGRWLVSVEADGKWGFQESTEELAREAAIADIMGG